MRYSQSFWKTYRQVPREAENISSALLLRAGYIDRLGAGLYSFLPLGWRVHKKIEEIMRKHLNNMGCEEVFLPALHPASLWQQTGRLKTMEPPLFTVKDRKGQTLVLASTHEEVITQLVGKFIHSYSDLPRFIYQIQTKFRNELRPTSGLLRTREFSMLDAYSFHPDQKDLDKFYPQISQAFERIFVDCDLQTVRVEAKSGSMGGEVSHEFLVLAPTGEDRALICDKCQKAWKKEVFQGKSCPHCQALLNQERAIENGHVFQLGEKYSQDLGITFIDKNNKSRPVVMGCYGIGIGRLLATVVEAHHDQLGIIWPASIAPYQVHLIGLVKEAEEIYEKLQQAKIEVFYDDREESAGIKLADGDLLGMPMRVVVSENTMSQGKVEIKKREEKEVKLVALDELVDVLKKL